MLGKYSLKCFFSSCLMCLLYLYLVFYHIILYYISYSKNKNSSHLYLFNLGVLDFHMVEDAQKLEIVCQKISFYRFYYQSSNNRTLVNAYKQQNNAMSCAVV